MKLFQIKAKQGVGTALFFLLAQWALAQKTEHPALFDQLLQQAGLEVFEPLDAGYRSFEPVENQYLNCHHAIRSNSEDLQIRYYVLPWDKNNYVASTPNVATFTALTAVASNDDEALISAIQLDKEEVHKDYNADWGMAYFFQPKPAFADWPACKMVALSKEGQGTVFVFYFFDDPGNTALVSGNWQFGSMRKLEIENYEIEDSRK